MKKVLSVMLAVLLTVSIAAFACGCGEKGKDGKKKSSDPMIGTWETQLDYADTYKGVFSSKELNLDELMLTESITLKEGGKCAYKREIDSKNHSALEEAMLDYYDLTAEEFEKDRKITITKFVDNMLDGVLMDETGKYTVKDDKLYIYEDELDEDDYYAFELDGDTLTFTEDSTIDAELPITFKRVK